MTTEEFNLENYSDFQTLKNDVNQYHLKYVVISNALGISRKDFVYLMKFENRNLSIENIKNNTKSILGIHKAEIKQYKKDKEKQRQEDKKRQEISKPAINNYNDYDYNDYDDYDDYDDYHPRYYSRWSSAKYEAIAKNRDLVDDYEFFKNSMCNGIGQRKIKLFLNKKIKAGDKIADLYRTALEIENCNINAKKYRNTMYHSYKDNLYDQKEELLKELLQKCSDYNKEAETPLIYGYQHTSNYSTNMLLYFDLPGVRQISFHCNISKREMPEDTPEYMHEWDEEVNSTLFKIEEAINERYKADLEKISSKK